MALTQLAALPLSTFEESMLNDFVQKPPPELKFSAVAIFQDLICVRLIHGGRYNEAIKLDRQFVSTTSPKNIKVIQDRMKMVHDVYAALPSVERALLDLELDPSSPSKPQLVPKNVSPERRKAVPQEPQESPLSQSWEDIRMPDTLVNKSTPLREVRVPNSTTPLSMPRFGGSSLHNPIVAPILPINSSSVASSSALAPRKSLPLTSSVLSSSQARPSMSGVGTRMLLNGSAAIASPASGIKFSKATLTSSHGPGHEFISATRQQNAFYQPPATKKNGVKRPFDETIQSPEHPNIPTNDADVVMAVEPDTDRPQSPCRLAQKGEQNKKAQEADDEDDNVLQFSVFKGRDIASAPEPPLRRKLISKSPPGSYVSEDDDAMDEDHDDERSKTTKSRPLRSSKSQTISKPPAKKARQVKNQEAKMSIPGSLVDDDEVEEEEEDYVAPLRAPSLPRRAARKARSSASVDMEDEGIQTRRRSSRLSTTGNTHSSAHSVPPESPAAAKTKKGTRGGAKKKR